VSMQCVGKVKADAYARSTFELSTDSLPHL
jgi:hypothetical protein